MYGSIVTDCLAGVDAIISLCADLITRLPPKITSPVAVVLLGGDLWEVCTGICVCCTVVCVDGVVFELL